MKVSTLKITAGILGLLLAMHAISLIVNNKSNSKKGYQSQNLIISVFYLMFSIVLIGGAFITQGGGGEGSNYGSRAGGYPL